jgi:outer membrane protein assembly factor BamB
MTKIEFEELSEWAWAIRELPSSVEAVFIDEDVILAGDKDGAVFCWNHEGEVLWKQDVGNRVENFVFTKKSNSANLFLVAGLEVIGLNYSSGEIIWRAELEGISDWVVIDEENDQIVVTSSVFDLEYYDFIEGCCWRFNFEGKLLDSHKMDEKAWHLYSNKDGAMLGLGRPKNGILLVNNDTYEHLEIVDSPICCGYKNIFGHANGSISILEEGEITTQKICDSAISSITIQNNDFLISNQDGKLYCNKENKATWEYESNESLSLINGIESSEIDMVFASTRTDNGSKLFLLDLNDGNEILTSETDSSIRISSSKENMLLLGMDNGKILIFEMDLLLRRLNQQKDSEEVDDSRKKMLERLRGLRK